MVFEIDRIRVDHVSKFSGELDPDSVHIRPDPQPLKQIHKGLNALMAARVDVMLVDHHLVILRDVHNSTLTH